MSLTKNEIKFIKGLQQKKNRDIHKLFIVEGEKLVKELFSQNKYEIDILYITSEYNDNSTPSGIEVQIISTKSLERISNLKTPNKVLAVVKQNQKELDNFDSDNLVLLLEDINDPGNLGTIIRTADWFGITHIIASPKTVELYNSKVIQSSMGAIYRINYTVTDIKNVLQHLKNIGFKSYGALLNGENIYNTSLPKKMALVMGNESHGLSENIINLLDFKISIPKFGKTESLNVAMATGILLSQYKSQ